MWGSIPNWLLCMWIYKLSWHHLLKKLFFPPFSSPGILVENQLTIDTCIYFTTLQFYWSIYNLYTSTTLSWLLQLCSKFWNQKVSPPTFSFSRLFWLFKITLQSHMNFRFVLFICAKRLLEFWPELRSICRSLWGVLPS